jgi:hypothetical protein
MLPQFLMHVHKVSQNIQKILLHLLTWEHQQLQTYVFISEFKAMPQTESGSAACCFPLPPPATVFLYMHLSMVELED